MIEKPNKNSPEKHLEAEVANFLQIGLLRKFLEKKLGTDFEKSGRKTEMELVWIKEHAPTFRIIFSENKEALIDAYKKDMESVVDLMEKILEDEL